MACSSKPGVKPFLDYIEAVTGEKVTQADWHDIREMAAKEYGVEGSLPKARASQYNVVAGFSRFDANINIGSYDASREAYDDACLKMQGKPVTEGTLIAVGYLSENGVKDTLAKVRLARAEKKKVENSETGRTEAEREGYFQELSDWTLRALGRKSKTVTVKDSYNDEDSKANTDEDIVECYYCGAFVSGDDGTMVDEVNVMCSECDGSPAWVNYS